MLKSVYPSGLPESGNETILDPPESDVKGRNPLGDAPPFFSFISPKTRTTSLKVSQADSPGETFESKFREINSNLVARAIRASYSTADFYPELQEGTLSGKGE